MRSFPAFDGEQEYEEAAAPVPVMADTMGAGDSLITSFMVSYLAAVKAGKSREEAIGASLAAAAGFAAGVCGLDGAWGHGVHYE